MRFELTTPILQAIYRAVAVVPMFHQSALRCTPEHVSFAASEIAESCRAVTWREPL